jgi:hypothetical protein
LNAYKTFLIKFKISSLCLPSNLPSSPKSDRTYDPRHCLQQGLKNGIFFFVSWPLTIFLYRFSNFFVSFRFLAPDFLFVSFLFVSEFFPFFRFRFVFQTLVYNDFAIYFYILYLYKYRLSI